jgi:hypothetical protein
MLPESSANHSAHSRSYPQAESFGETHHGVDHGRPGEHPQMLVCRFTCRSHEQVRQSPSRRDMQKSNELFGEGIQILVHQPEKPQPQKQNQQPLSGFKDHYRAQRQRFGGRSMHFTTTVPARRYGVAVQSLSSVECSAQSLSVKLCTSLAGAQRPNVLLAALLWPLASAAADRSLSAPPGSECHHIVTLLPNPIPRGAKSTRAPAMPRPC